MSTRVGKVSSFVLHHWMILVVILVASVARFWQLEIWGLVLLQGTPTWLLFMEQFPILHRAFWGLVSMGTVIIVYEIFSRKKQFESGWIAAACLSVSPSLVFGARAAEWQIILPCIVSSIILFVTWKTEPQRLTRWVWIWVLGVTLLSVVFGFNAMLLAFSSTLVLGNATTFLVNSQLKRYFPFLVMIILVVGIGRLLTMRVPQTTTLYDVRLSLALLKETSGPFTTYQLTSTTMSEGFLRTLIALNRSQMVQHQPSLFITQQIDWAWPILFWEQPGSTMRNYPAITRIPLEYWELYVHSP